jgi:hypothetical protein
MENVDLDGRSHGGRQRVQETRFVCQENQQFFQARFTLPVFRVVMVEARSVVEHKGLPNHPLVRVVIAQLLRDGARKMTRLHHDPLLPRPTSERRQ